MIMFDRRLIENFDWLFLITTLGLTALGVINLYSASQVFSGNGSPVYLKQVYWALIGLAAMLCLVLVSYRLLQNLAYFFYGVGLVFLILVMVLGFKTSGAQRWIDFGLFRFQPSELVKLAVLFALAQYYSRRKYPKGQGVKDLIGPGLLVGIPFALILQQPDLGTALHLAFACATVILYVGVRQGTFFLMTGGLTVLLPFGWMILKDYQKRRVLTFLDPESDPLGAGYHIIQSKIAVGSGEFWGKGFMQGTQSQLRFLPEQHTDFAFSVFAEEWGFIGSLVLLALFFLLIVAALRIVRRSQDRFGTLLSLGLASMIFWQFFINLCMVTGLMPVVGLPLPFISYGGSSLLTVYCCIGLMLNVSMRRYLFLDQVTGGPSTEV